MAMKAWCQTIQSLFTGADRDRNRTLSSSELASLPAEVRQAAWDADRDGVYTLAEVFGRPIVAPGSYLPDRP